ncbi:hypothetical protein GCM10027160_21570 [Streptomyces calidiresistens]|uniref:Uncharacterized protein n=1 Tax=Streptomyces calidiresistens TaxID=1485586 RepID=A0A7W3T380_9ACTN|nr:hypothetical protein [Streptomyces calidiresistens]MBB0229978.1 hypothetical protein [Streptomyces calidiresistens]
MPLYLPPAPEPAERCVRTALRSPVVRAPHSRESHRVHPEGREVRESREDLVPARPLPVHQWEVGAAPAASAPLVGWRFLLMRDGLPVGTAETRLTADGWAFSHFGEGPYAASTDLALRRADELEETWSPCLLSVPRLYMLTLWLRPAGKADGPPEPATGGPVAGDLLVPLAPAPPGIAANRPMTAATLHALVGSRLAPAQLAG